MGSKGASKPAVIFLIEHIGIKLEMLFNLRGFFRSSCDETLQFLCFFPCIVYTVKNREVGKKG